MRSSPNTPRQSAKAVKQLLVLSAIFLGIGFSSFTSPQGLNRKPSALPQYTLTQEAPSQQNINCNKGINFLHKNFGVETQTLLVRLDIVNVSKILENELNPLFSNQEKLRAQDNIIKIIEDLSSCRLTNEDSLRKQYITNFSTARKRALDKITFFLKQYKKNDLSLKDPSTSLSRLIRSPDEGKRLEKSGICPSEEYFNKICSQDDSNQRNACLQSLMEKSHSTRKKYIDFFTFTSSNICVHYTANSNQTLYSLDKKSFISGYILCHDVFALEQKPLPERVSLVINTTRTELLGKMDGSLLDHKCVQNAGLPQELTLPESANHQ